MITLADVSFRSQPTARTLTGMLVGLIVLTTIRLHQTKAACSAALNRLNALFAHTFWDSGLTLAADPEMINDDSGHSNNMTNDGHQLNK